MERPELLDPKLDLDQIWEKPGPQQHPRPCVPGAEKEWTERVRVWAWEAGGPSARAGLLPGRSAGGAPSPRVGQAPPASSCGLPLRVRARHAIACRRMPRVLTLFITSSDLLTGLVPHQAL